MELQDLKQQGQSAKADYVQTLFLWLSKKSGKVLMLPFLNQHLHFLIIHVADASLSNLIIDTRPKPTELLPCCPLPTWLPLKAEV